MTAATPTDKDARPTARAPFPAAELSDREQLRRAFPALTGWRPAPSAADREQTAHNALCRQRRRDSALAAESRAQVAAILDAEHLARLDARRAELPDTPAWAAGFWRAQLRPLMVQNLDHGDHTRDMGERALPRHWPAE